MSSSLKNLSEHSGEIPLAADMRFGILVSKWNEEITSDLYKGALNTLYKSGALEKNINTRYVPGSFELSIGAQFMAEYTDVDAIICIGCVIQGETKHFDFICDALANGITAVSMKFDKPVIFGVLTTNDWQQAKDRSGGKHGNKGDEAAFSAIRMIALQRSLKF